MISTHLRPVIGNAVVHADKITELVVVRVVPNVLYVIDKNGTIVQIWKFAADITAVCVLRTKSKDGVRKCRIFVATSNCRIWCLYFPPPWISRTDSDDFLSSQLTQIEKRKPLRTSKDETQDSKKRKKPENSTESKNGNAKGNSNSSDSINITIKNVAPKNCVSTKEIVTKMFLLGNHLLALHGEKEDLPFVLVHTIESFQPYFDPPDDSLGSPVLYPPPTPTPTPSLPTSTPSLTPSFAHTPSHHTDPAPTPKITTNIPTKGMTCLIHLSLASETQQRVTTDNLLDKNLFIALFGIDKAIAEQVVLVWGDVSGKVYFTTTSFSDYSVLFDLKEPVHSLMASRAVNSFFIIGKQGKVIVMKASPSQHLLYADTLVPSPISHSAFISSGGLVTCARGVLSYLHLPARLEELNKIRIKTLPFSGVAGIQVCARGSALVLLRSGKLLKIRDISEYLREIEKFEKPQNLLPPLMLLMSHIDKEHTSLMNGRVQQQNEELMVTNKALRVFSDIKAFHSDTAQECPLNVRIALFPAPHMAGVYPRSNVIMRCAVKNSHKFEFAKRFWNLSFRIEQRDYPGSFVTTFSPPLEMQKAGLWTFDFPVPLKSLCPVTITTFLCFKGFVDIPTKQLTGGYGAGMKISHVRFDVFDLLCPVLSGDPTASIKSPFAARSLSAFRTVEIINSALKDINRKMNKPSFLPIIAPPPTSHKLCIGPPFSAPAPQNLSDSTPSIATLLYSLLSAGETGMAPHKVLQNTSLAVGISPFGEKISLTLPSPSPTRPPSKPTSPPQTKPTSPPLTKPTSPPLTKPTSPPLPATSLPPLSSLPSSPLVTLDIHCQAPTSLPLLHHATLHRFFQLLHDPPDLSHASPRTPAHAKFPITDAGENFPFADVLRAQAKLREFQKSLRELSDELAIVWQKVHKKGDKNEKKEARSGKNGKKEKEVFVEEEDEEVEIQPKKWEDDVRRVMEIVTKCMKVYEECRKVLGTEFIM